MHMQYVQRATKIHTFSVLILHCMPLINPDSIFNAKRWFAFNDFSSYERERTNQYSTNFSTHSPNFLNVMDCHESVLEKLSRHSAKTCAKQSVIWVNDPFEESKRAHQQ